MLDTALVLRHRHSTLRLVVQQEFYSIEWAVVGGLPISCEIYHTSATTIASSRD